jgi:carboxylesterase type B
MMKINARTLLLYLVTHVTTASPLQPTVETANGTLTGLYNTQYNQDFFLGIPYAQPPIGPLRYHRPQPVSQPWSNRNATVPSPGCHSAPVNLPVFTQSGFTYPESEDCLTLNVVRPANLHAAASLPVLVYIHGGGFQEGSGADQRYNTSFLVQESVRVNAPIISVTINHRLSGFGFLPGSAALQSGIANLGLHDQRMALQWVQENIAAFGGDKEKVTIHGESAGAMAIGHHLLAYGGRDDGLFRAAILQSGGPAVTGPIMPLQAQDRVFNIVLERTGCAQNNNTLDCLRSLPAEALKAAFQDQVFMPVQDGEFFTGNPRLALQQGRFVRKPILVGTNTNEGTSLTINAGLRVSNRSQLHATIAAYLGAGASNTTVDAVVAEYLDRMPLKDVETSLGSVLPSSQEYSSLYGRVTLFVGDYTFVAARRLSTEMWARYGIPAYSFRFDTVPSGVSPEMLGAAHFAEIPFVFRNLDGVGHEVNFLASNSTSERDALVNLSRRMSRMWVSFVNELSPNARYASESNTTWPAYKNGSAMNMVFRKDGICLEEDSWRASAISRLNSALVESGA